MAEQNSTSKDGLPNGSGEDKNVAKTSKDVGASPASTAVTGPFHNSQPSVCTTLTPINPTTTIGNTGGLLFFLNSGSTTHCNTATSSKTPNNAVFVPQAVCANLISQVQNVMTASKPENNSNDVIEKAMDLSDLNSDVANSDCNQHPLTNAALTLVSLGSTVGPPVQEIVIDQSGRSSFATNSNLDEVSVTVESEGSSQGMSSKGQGDHSGLGPMESIVDNSCDSMDPKDVTVHHVREVVTQTGGGPGEVVILKSIRKARSKSLSSYLTEQSLERKRRAEMKIGEAQKQATDRHRNHACDQCEKKFFTRHDLKRHTLVHSDERPHPCMECEKAFRTRNELNLHTPVHNKTTPYKCEFCGKEFRTKGCFKSHIKYHIGDKRHKCSICDRAFVKSADLKRHVAGHNNEKNFKCDECDSSFTRRDNLKAHMLLHTRSSVVNCDKCNKEFINTVYLKRHMHVHKQAKKKPYECQWCPKTYEQLEGLRRHIRQHVGDEKFVCEHCSKRFMTAIQLKRHLWLSHEQTSPYRKSVL